MSSYVEGLQWKMIERLRKQRDSLQEKVHLCAAYDRLESENERLRAALEKIAGHDEWIISGSDPDEMDSYCRWCDSNLTYGRHEADCAATIARKALELNDE